MACRRKRATYRKKSWAKRHGAITYGRGKYYIYKVKKGWRAGKK